MEDITGISPDKTLDEWSQVIFNSIDEFILFTSGYYDLEKNPPSGMEIDYAKEEWIIELTSLQAALVSGVVAMIPSQFKIPALTVEYFLNNRFHAEMIAKLKIKKEGNLTPRDFLICLSATGTTSIEDAKEREQIEIFLEKMRLFVSRGVLKTYSQNFFDIITSKAIASLPLMDSIISGVFSYIETKNIAKNTVEFMEGKKTTVYLAEH
ncbi:MAG: hypothetical protein KDK36_03240, partial [Leptospiraceae bacterium]|nr:hypothetical protein [Leptospiraceae bacterium]